MLAEDGGGVFNLKGMDRVGLTENISIEKSKELRKLACGKLGKVS